MTSRRVTNWVNDIILDREREIAIRLWSNNPSSQYDFCPPGKWQNLLWLFLIQFSQLIFVPKSSRQFSDPNDQQPIAKLTTMLYFLNKQVIIFQTHSRFNRLINYRILRLISLWSEDLGHRTKRPNYSKLNSTNSHFHGSSKRNYKQAKQRRGKANKTPWGSGESKWLISEQFLVKMNPNFTIARATDTFLFGTQSAMSLINIRTWSINKLPGPIGLNFPNTHTFHFY